MEPKTLHNLRKNKNRVAKEQVLNNKLTKKPIKPKKSNPIVPNPLTKKPIKPEKRNTIVLNPLTKKPIKPEKSNPIVPKPLAKKPIKTEESNPIVPKPSKKKKYLMPSKTVSDNLIESCLNALRELAVKSIKKNAIFEDETAIFAEIRCMKIQNATGNIKFLYPHSTVASTGEICLIVPDLKKGKKPDHEPTIDHWKEILEKAGVENVKTVLPMRQLRVEYDQYELKRRLLTQHDFIMVDTRILSHVSHLLGKMFFKKHNMLIPVRIDENKNIKKNIEVGIHTAMMRLRVGVTSTVLVGHTGMSTNDLKENVMSLIKQLKDKYPGGEANIRSISLKLPLSLPLPLYLTLRPSSVINVPKLTKKRPKNFSEFEDELSTIPDSIVRVAPDGTVRVKKMKLAPSEVKETEESQDEEEIESVREDNDDDDE